MIKPAVGMVTTIPFSPRSFNVVISVDAGRYKAKRLQGGNVGRVYYPGTRDERKIFVSNTKPPQAVEWR